MISRNLTVAILLTAGTAAAFATADVGRAASPSAAQALRLSPSQSGIDYDRPKPEDVPRCKISAKKIDGHVGWIVESPDGVVLRKFLDTDGDNVVDQWSYFKDGVEVYREIATKAGGKANEFRWLNTGGTRWGIDTEGSGKVTEWKAISAEEVTAEIVAALADRDADRFARVLLTADELSSLGLGKAKADAAAAKITKAATDFRELIDRQKGADRQKAIPADAKWLQFSGSRPGIVPSGTEDSTRDLEAYENVVAIVQVGDKNVQVQIGTLVHVGKSWKTIDAPSVGGDGQPAVFASGFFFQGSPSAEPLRGNAGAGVVAGVDDASQKLIHEMEGMDPSDPRRLEIIQRLVDQSKTGEERSMWLRQLADTLSAGVQTGKLADGEKRLEALLEKARGDSDQNLAAYVKIRLLTATYAREISAKDADPTKIQTKWTKNLEQFIDDYTRTPDAAEAMLQLGIAREYGGQDDEAKKWYERIGREFAGSPQAKKAAGAVRRLDSVGTVLSLSGRGLNGQTIDLANYRGKAVLVQYWATWCTPAKNDMAVLKQLVGKYGRSFAVIGVSVDAGAKELNTYLAENQMPWEQIYEEGGQDSRPANALGIITVPTMILVDPEGKVINRSIQVGEIEAELKKLSQ
jgi:thiol-disulfide isomerase/thioredoxin